ncbi:MAG: hypothetical protein EAX96_08960 [Candidatus Lokiarchaeota archaeon]|nr:hypothetical protein [Candidatus Lokiarchaeota archaeon]
MSEKSPRTLLKERNQRIKETIAIKEPDRVPITPMSTFFATEQVGMTKKEAMYDMKRTTDASVKVFSRYNWDAVPPIQQIYPAKYFDLMGAKFFKWPGAENENQRLKDHLPYQFVEAEYLKANEYEEFFDDPTGFCIHRLLQRQWSEYKAFSNFPYLSNLASGYGALIGFPFFFFMPETKEMFKRINESVDAFFQWFNHLMRYENEMKKLGYPLQFMAMTQAPYDIVSDYLRGMKGTMLDMYRNPEELKHIMDLLTQSLIDSALQLAQMVPQHKIIFMPLHRGAEGFMNDKQFQEFYFPTLCKVFEGLMKNNLIPMPFWEGKCTARFPYLAEFAEKHKAKMIFWFDQSDIFKAKEAFGNHVCIRGNVPGSLLVTGTPKEVEEYVKKCIEGCAEGGGYLLDGGVSGIPDEAKAENVKAMTEAVFKYGVYRK